MKLAIYQKNALIRSIMNDVPFPSDEDITAQLQAAMSPDARKLYRKNQKALRSECIHGVFPRSSRYFVVGDADYEAVVKPYQDRLTALEDVRRNLKSIVYGCSTVERFRKMLPEFEEYLPSATKITANLPIVSNVVADLVKMGWAPATSEVAA